MKSLVVSLSLLLLGSAFEANAAGPNRIGDLPYDYEVCLAGSPLTGTLNCIKLYGGQDIIKFGYNKFKNESEATAYDLRGSKKVEKKLDALKTTPMLADSCAYLQAIGSIKPNTDGLVAGTPVNTSLSSRVYIKESGSKKTVYIDRSSLRQLATDCPSGDRKTGSFFISTSANGKGEYLSQHMAVYHWVQLENEKADRAMQRGMTKALSEAAVQHKDYVVEQVDPSLGEICNDAGVLPGHPIILQTVLTGTSRDGRTTDMRHVNQEYFRKCPMYDVNNPSFE